MLTKASWLEDAFNCWCCANSEKIAPAVSLSLHFRSVRPICCLILCTRLVILLSFDDWNIISHNITNLFDVCTGHESLGNDVSNKIVEKSAITERHLQEASTLQAEEEHSFTELQNALGIKLEQQKLDLPSVPQMLRKGVVNSVHWCTGVHCWRSEISFSLQLEFQCARAQTQKLPLFIGQCFWQLPNIQQITKFSHPALIY